MKWYFIRCEFYFGEQLVPVSLDYSILAKGIKNARKKAEDRIKLLNFVCPFAGVRFKVIDIYEVLK